MVEKQVVRADEAPHWPEPIAPATLWNGLIFVSGELGVDPTTLKPAGADVVSQARQALRNIDATLRAASSSLDHILKISAYLAEPADYEAFNRTFGEEFPHLPPARTTIGARLIGDEYRVEIEAIAYQPSTPPT